MKISISICPSIGHLNSYYATSIYTIDHLNRSSIYSGMAYGIWIVPDVESYLSPERWGNICQNAIKIWVHVILTIFLILREKSPKSVQFRNKFRNAR